MADGEWLIVTSRSLTTERGGEMGDGRFSFEDWEIWQ